MNIKALVVLTSILLSACSGDPDENLEALRKAGYTGVRLGGYAWFLCDEKDQFRQEFSGRGPTGVPVSGAVCSGLFKGHTIRIE